jgi:hypothetical protein
VGKRHADKLVKVFLKSGKEVWLLIHIEVQVQRDADFAERMFVYNYRLYDKYKHKVVSLALLGDTHPEWRPDHFGYGDFGCRMELRFPSVKLWDYRDRMPELEQSRNPFALATLAHLVSQQTKDDLDQRFQWKLKLYRLLKNVGWDRKQVRDLLVIYDFMLTLSEELDKQIHLTLNKETGGTPMEMVTSYERIALKEGAIEMISLLLREKFGQLPEWAEQRIRDAELPQLKEWAKAFVTKSSLEEILI